MKKSRLIVGVLGSLWAGLGIVGMLVLMRVLSGMLAYYVVLLPPMLLSLPPRSPITDAAHGPSFLNIWGVLLVYVIPGAAAAIGAFWHAQKPAPREIR
jgi:hypothetical protein